MHYVILGQTKKMQLFYYSAVNSKSRIWKLKLATTTHIT